MTSKITVDVGPALAALAGLTAELERRRAAPAVTWQPFVEAIGYWCTCSCKRCYDGFHCGSTKCRGG
jgi:hypothetical protein